MADERRQTAAKLSPQQRRILVALLKVYRHYRAADLVGFAKSDFHHWGIDRSHIYPGDLTRSETAVFSRALQRLEERGLLQRRNQMSGDKHSLPSDGLNTGKHRTTHLKLIQEGEALAQWLEEQMANR